MSNAIIRVYSYGNEATYWSVSSSAQTTAGDICEDLATKLLEDDEIFVMFELKTSKKTDRVQGERSAYLNI
jgi:hypothetical protein